MPKGIKRQIRYWSLSLLTTLRVITHASAIPFVIPSFFESCKKFNSGSLFSLVSRLNLNSLHKNSYKTEE